MAYMMTKWKRHPRRRLKQDVEDDTQDQKTDGTKETSIVKGPLKLHPPNIDTFYAILKQAKLRFRLLSKPYECKICQEAPAWEKELDDFLELKKVTKDLTADESMKFEELRRQKANITRHRDQLETQRKFIDDTEDKLPIRTESEFKVVVYEDFVSQYSEKAHNYGMKVVSLVFTIKWKGDDGKIRKLFLDFFCSDDSGSADVRHVWTLLLRVNKELKELNRAG